VAATQPTSAPATKPDRRWFAAGQPESERFAEALSSDKQIAAGVGLS